MKIQLTKVGQQRKLEACQAVDANAEQIRLQFVTPGAGQMLAYQEKVREAEAYLLDELASVPHLEAEVGITGESVYHVAQIVLGLRDYWKTVSAAIERTRLQAKASIMAATNQTELALAQNPEWPV